MRAGHGLLNQNVFFGSIYEKHHNTRLAVCAQVLRLQGGGAVSARPHGRPHHRGGGQRRAGRKHGVPLQRNKKDGVGRFKELRPRAHSARGRPSPSRHFKGV